MRKMFNSFLDSIEEEYLNLEQLTSSVVLNYVQTLRAKGMAAKSIQHQIKALGHYFKFKGISRQILQHINIKDICQPLPEQLLSEAQLLDIYETYKVENDIDQRDRCMLGLLVFQGVTTREVVELNLDEVNLKSQIIEIGAGRSTAGGRLVLRENQIKDLGIYLNQVRPRLLSLKLKPTNQFFLTNGTSEKKAALRNGIQRMSDRLKNRLSWYKHTRQLRASVITNWFTHSSLRQVQYMAGHRYISSTERYQLGRILEVEEALSKFHPKR